MNISVLGVPFTLSGSHATALTVGPNGLTSPTFQVVTNTGSGVSGVQITNTIGGPTIAAIDGGSDANLLLNAKGTGYTKLSASKLGIGTTPTYGLHLAPTSGLTAGQTVFIQDATATTGITTVSIQLGAGQSTAAGLKLLKTNGTTSLQWIDSGTPYFGTELIGLFIGGSFDFGNAAGTTLYADVSSAGITLRQIGVLGFSNSSSNPYTPDTGWSRISAGVMGAGTGSAASFAGGIKLKQITHDQGTITASTPMLTGTATWNDGAVTFVNNFVNITSTASAAGSLLAQWQVGGANKFTVSKAGLVDAVSYAVGGAAGASFSGSGATFAALTTVTFVNGILTVAA